MKNEIKLAINGFGRIGRTTFRRLYENPLIDIVAVNDIADIENLAHLLRYDSVHGPLQRDVKVEGSYFVIGNKKIKILNEQNPAVLPWKELDIDIVLESTGKFTRKKDAEKHLQAGAKRVIISAPAIDEQEEIKFIVMGINENRLAKDDLIVSNSSCTTNCVAPMIKILDDNWGIEKAFITTVHSYTKDQNLIDAPHKDYRRGRSAAASIVPTTTGAAKASTRIFPHLKHNLGGAGIRVPVQDGSLTDLTCTLGKSATVEEINRAFLQQAQGELKGILEYTEHPIVSVDIIGNSHSAIFDAKLTAVLGDTNKLVKIVAWYDNESGYSARLEELILLMGKLMKE